MVSKTFVSKGIIGFIRDFSLNNRNSSRNFLALILEGTDCYIHFP